MTHNHSTLPATIFASTVRADWSSLLPIRSLEEFLPNLAHCWRAETALSLAAVLLNSCGPGAAAGGLAIGFAGENGVRRFLRLRSEAPAVSHAAGDDGDDPIRNLFQRHGVSIPRLIRSCAVELDHGVVARVILADDQESALPPDAACQCFLESMTALLQQAVWMDNPLHTPQGRAALERAKFEAIAQFAAGAGHEINNPVATIVGRAQLLLQGESDIDRRQQLLTIGGQALRIRDMIGDAMLFGRPPAPRFQTCDLSAMAVQQLENLRPRANEQQAALLLEAPAPFLIWADPAQVEIVIQALVRNSLNAVPRGGCVTVAVCSTEDDASSVRLVVTDNGPGLTEADREHLFDPFYSGRQAGRGLGFGLPKARRIIEAHGGTITVISEPGRTTVQTTWPRSDQTGR